MATIKPIDNGPLMVSGLDTLPNDGKILKDREGNTIENASSKLVLCRCGQSKNKPFCDGTHRGFDFNTEKEKEKINKELSYKGTVEGKEVDVTFNPMLCGHAAECGRLHQAVFDSGKRPWVQPENGTIEGIKSVIKACPSGALRVSIDGDAMQHIDSDDVEITVFKNGPFSVKNIELEATFNGVGASKKEYILCRCGLSKNKPFCDGTHRDENWDDSA